MFSVVIPLYNKAHTIRRTLHTVLYQTYQDFEVIIVDDGSTDNGVEVIKKFTNDTRIKILNQENQGASVARNNGIKNANRKFIALLDGDDEWLPEYLAKMREVILKIPDAGMYCCAGYVRDKDGLRPRLARKYKDQTLKINYFENPFVFSHTSATILRKAEFMKTDGFPPGMKVNQDMALFYSMAFFTPVVYHGEMLSIYVGGVSGQTTSASKDEKFNQIIHIINRINMCYDIWHNTNKENKLYLIFDKYETRQRILQWLKVYDYRSINYFIKHLGQPAKSYFSRIELWLYKMQSLNFFARGYIYFTKIIWRTYGFPIIGK